MKERFSRLLGQCLAMLLVMATRPLIGGQAVIEGVMMRSPHSFAVALRKSDGTIIVRERPWLSFSQSFPFLRWPLFRGANMLIESMYNGMSALQFSAEQAMDSASEEKKEQNKSGKLDWALLATMVGSMLLGIGLFKAIPHITAFLIGEWFATGGESALPITSMGFHLVDGAVKMLLFVGYILAISRFEDVKRLFMYHGAEHKSVHAWEKRLALDTDQTRIQSTAHPRCGTSLILLVIVVSILVFALIIPHMPRVSEVNWIQSVFSLIIKIPLMLPIAGVAYEFQRAASKYPDHFLVRLFIAPGMLMQRLTTREPDDEQLEVALTALRKAVWREERVAASGLVSKSTDEIEVFSDFAAVKKALA